jgi:hypothetical protein
MDACAPQTPRESPQQIRRDATFIEKPILAHVAEGLPPSPLPPLGGDIRSALFIGVNGFF